MTTDKKSRRNFLKGSAIAAGVGMTSLQGIAPPSVLGANDTINMGIIGVGDRGSWGMRELIKRNARIAALCDVCEDRFDAARPLTESPDGKLADLYYEHERVLERDDIDGVYIATPDHWHHDILIDAVQAGKDCYTEKPFSKTIAEGQDMVRAVRATKQIVQVGNHRRSGKHWKKAQEIIRSGKIGKVVWVKVYDMRNWTKGDPWENKVRAGVRGRIDWTRFLGKAPRRPFDAQRYFTWRWYWDYAGGLLTDIGAHQLDVNQWLMDVDGPKTVAANGGNHFFPTWETPDVAHTVLNYGNFTTTFSVQFINSSDSVGAAFYGSEGTLKVDDRTGFRLFIPQESTEPVETWDRHYEGGDHVANFLECMRSRKEPNSPVETGHKVINAAHLSNISYRTGKTIQWDPDTEEILDVRRTKPSDSWLKSRL